MEVALVAGLIGALLSAALSYWVRAALAKRARRESERRLAYVHLVTISELVAVDVLVRSFVEVFSDHKAFVSLAGSEGKYEPSHKMSVLIVEALQQLPREKLKETPGISTIPRLIRSLVDGIEESQRKPEQLALLPRETILNYSFFLTYLGQLKQILSLWADFFEHDDRSWLTPEAIHDQWLRIGRFFEQARSLRTTLVKEGALSADEASALLKKKVDKYNEILMSNWKHQPKIQAAMEATKREVANAAAQPPLAGEASLK